MSLMGILILVMCGETITSSHLILHLEQVEQIAGFLATDTVKVVEYCTRLGVWTV